MGNEGEWWHRGVKAPRGVEPARLGARKGFRDQLANPRVAGKVKALRGDQPVRRHDGPGDLIRRFANKAKRFEANQLGKPHRFRELRGIAPRVDHQPVIERFDLVDLRGLIVHKAKRLEANINDQLGKPHRFRELRGVAPRVDHQPVHERFDLVDFRGLIVRKAKRLEANINDQPAKPLRFRERLGGKKLGDIGGVQPAATPRAFGMIVNMTIKIRIKVERVLRFG